MYGLVDSDSFRSKFPFWERLHGLWRTLPNFNPHPLSSDPGQCIGEQMEALIAASGSATVEFAIGGEAEADEPGTGTPDVEGISGGAIEVCNVFFLF